ncbi:hydroxyacylglutathione hydrolase [Candidatus Methylopumilus planktonicus]|jgi:hydroxyacylglutathione hydrolase|uniref:hydroxyacylglutathione hydrolase n=1 Tax=Candidatus Methylopumilus planktonicus TaxID=1581557 RepID=UPI0011211AA1|nr:hydroxyacylglutathione hydrolase [Candidatus Methylopumilus planktonicus]QDD10983.1 hydroxyacylglutathione hydrolase [Candidatus Methylopumilus planktonicus]QDD23453.1 hydroxyacylglutathione hydrolase [Candidatus Methylopumilus planktonicus]
MTGYKENQLIHIDPIEAFQDNYIWLIHNDQNSVIVDPGDAGPVISALERKNLNLVAILITHHHADHIGGVIALQEKYPHIKIFAPQKDKYDFVNISLKNGDEINIPELQINYKIIEIPGHTRGHIAYYDKKNLFCGDTLFACGCGKIFDGTHEQMYNSLKKISALPKDTKIYCAHEYTKKNISFALSLDPDDTNLKLRKALVSNIKNTIPSSLEEELKTNPFLKCTSLEAFKRLRDLKDQY